MGKLIPWKSKLGLITNREKMLTQTEIETLQKLAHDANVQDALLAVYISARGGTPLSQEGLGMSLYKKDRAEFEKLNKYTKQWTLAMEALQAYRATLSASYDECRPHEQKVLESPHIITKEEFEAIGRDLFGDF